jgi:thioredoxin 1
MGDVITLTDANFDQEVLKSVAPVLVDFWAPWCAPCRAIAPVIDALATKHKDKLKVGKLDVDQNQDITALFGIQGIPTLYVFKDGKMFGVDRNKLEESVIEIIEK